MSGLSSITKNATSGGEGIGLYLDGASKYWGVTLLATAAAGTVTPVDSSNPLPVSAASLPLPSGAATATKQDTGNTSVASIDTKTPALGAAAMAAAVPVTIATDDARVGPVNEMAPATDTASSGLNGRLQRIAQRLTSLIAQIPATLGIKTAANSLSVTLASDQAALPVTDNSGSLTVDAPVATPVYVRLSDGAAAISTLPVSLASVPSHAVTNAGTFAVQDSEKIADNAGFTDGTTKVLPLGMIYDEVAGTALSENDIGTPRMDAKRGVVVVVEDATTRGQRMAVAATGEAAANVAKINGVAPSMGNGASGTGVQRVTIASDSTGQVALAAGTNGIGKLTANSGVVIGDVNVVAGINPVVNVSASYTRPADTTAYAAGDCYNSSTSSPTVLTFTSAARASGKGGVVTSLTVVDSNAPGTPIQGELWLFDSAPTSTNDNAAYALSDSDALKLVGVIPFTTVVTAANNSIATVQGLSIAFQCSGSADLRGQVRVTNAYTPASAETLGFRLGIIQGD